ncbi:MAG: hypothetical protein ACYDDU_14995, partial [Dermatophilaceae bacterium]
APPASPPCAAKKPAASGRQSGNHRTLRRAQPDPATYESGSHPMTFVEQEQEYVHVVRRFLDAATA